MSASIARPAPPAHTAIRDGNIYRPGGTGEYAILAGLYLQCEPNNQAIMVDPRILIACGEAFVDSHDQPSAHHVVKLLAEGCLQHCGISYALTWKGFRSAERCAVKRGAARIRVTTDSFAPPVIKPPTSAIAVPPAQQPVAQSKSRFAHGYGAVLAKKRHLSPSDSFSTNLTPSASESQVHLLPLPDQLRPEEPQESGYRRFRKLLQGGSCSNYRSSCRQCV